LFPALKVSLPDKEIVLGDFAVAVHTRSWVAVLAASREQRCPVIIIELAIVVEVTESWIEADHQRNGRNFDRHLAQNMQQVPPPTFHCAALLVINQSQSYKTAGKTALEIQSCPL